MLQLAKIVEDDSLNTEVGGVKGMDKGKTIVVLGRRARSEGRGV